MSRPPRLARAAVERAVASHLADAVLGDLEELFAAECRAVAAARPARLLAAGRRRRLASARPRAASARPAEEIR